MARPLPAEGFENYVAIYDVKHRSRGGSRIVHGYADWVSITDQHARCNNVAVISDGAVMVWQEGVVHEVLRYR